MTREPGPPVLRVEGLSVAYATPAGRVRAVDDGSFVIRRGEVLGLVGESGSGKSTIAAAILRLLAPNATIESGRVLLDGQELVTMPADALRTIRGNRLGVIFQDPQASLTPSIRVGDQIAEVLRVHRRLSAAAAEARALELLASVGIPHPEVRARAYPHQLSGGMQQRVLIAIALACDPDVLIMDEPTTALDVTTEANILDLIVDLTHRVSAGILYITHDMGVVARLCDRVAVLYASQLLEEGTIADIFYAPRHPYTKGLLASIPRGASVDAAKRLAAIPGRIPRLEALPGGCLFGPRCPFAAEGCADRSQPLRGAARPVRCERADALAGIAWPEPPRELAPARPQDGGPLVRAEGLTKEFRAGGWWAGFTVQSGGPWGLRVVRDPHRVLAVNGVTLEVREGETLGLVGESGCGKTTLGRMLVRLIDPTTGRAFFGDVDLLGLAGRDLRARRRDIQIVFQNPDSSLNPRQRIGTILARPLRVFGLADRKRIVAQVGELLRMVHLPAEYAARYPHELSGGEKQRVAIARVLATRPRFIVLDEPVTALDVSVRASVLNLLLDLQARLGLTYLLIAHDLGVIRQVADRVAVMYRGRVCELGTAAAVFAPPFHPYTRALLSAIPIPDPIRARQAVRIRLTDQMRVLTTDAGCVFRDRCPVKIGAICDEVSPPARLAAPGHTIACHHELPALMEGVAGEAAAPAA